MFYSWMPIIHTHQCVISIWQLSSDNVLEIVQLPYVNQAIAYKYVSSIYHVISQIKIRTDHMPITCHIQ